MSILLVLLESEGALVTREDLRARLWSSDTFVQFEHGLNSAIKRLRDTLNDSVDQPRYIQTVPGEGYRFIAEIEHAGAPLEVTPLTAVADDIPPRKANVVQPWLWAAAAVLAVTAAATSAWWSRHKDPAPTITFAKNDYVLVAQFENRTGEASLDGVVGYAVQRELDNSHYVAVAPPERIQDTLALMKKPADTPLDRNLTREVCLRDGSIKLFIVGRIEKVGSQYVLSASLVDPASDLTLRSYSEPAGNQNQILEAARRLSNEVREHLGEALPAVKQDERLVRVTTTSLNALRLYSEADVALRENRPGEAEPLLHEAVQDDPQFASAYILLAWALFNQGSPKSRFLPAVHRALELSATVGERERLFIQASYYDVQNNVAKARAIYQQLLALYPDDYWAANNLLPLLRSLREKNEVMVRLAEQRPMNPEVTFRAWDTLALLRDPRAQRYLERVEALGAQDVQTSDPDSAVGLAWAPVMAALNAREIDLAERRAEAVEHSPRLQRMAFQKSVFSYQGDFHLYLGQLKRARQFYERIHDDGYGYRWVALTILEGHDGNRTAMKDDAVRAVQTISGAGVFPLLQEAGLQTAARQIFRRDAQDGFVKTGREGERDGSSLAEIGEMALVQGDRERGISLLIRALPIYTQDGHPATPLIAQSLAKALVEEGRMNDAIAVLEPLERDGRFLGCFELIDPNRPRVLLAGLYRKMGRVQDAQKIEADLLHLWQDAIRIIPCSFN